MEMCKVYLGAIFLLLNSDQYFCEDQSTNVNNNFTEQTTNVNNLTEQTTNVNNLTGQTMNVNDLNGYTMNVNSSMGDMTMDSDSDSDESMVSTTTEYMIPSNLFKFDCHNRMIPYENELKFIWGQDKFESFSQVIYDEKTNRSEFVYSVLKKEMMVSKQVDCPRPTDGVNPNDDVAQLIDHRFGGPCTKYNTFPLSPDCNKGLWHEFNDQLAVIVKRDELVLFCAKLIYDDRVTNRPSKIVATVYAMPPTKTYLTSIVFNNSVSSESAPKKCVRLDEDRDLVRMN